jgi:hypothetical protein
MGSTRDPAEDLFEPYPLADNPVPLKKDEITKQEIKICSLD